jgi:hypothetical protein
LAPPGSAEFTGTDAGTADFTVSAGGALVPATVALFSRSFSEAPSNVVASLLLFVLSVVDGDGTTRPSDSVAADVVRGGVAGRLGRRRFGTGGPIFFPAGAAAGGFAVPLVDRGVVGFIRVVVSINRRGGAC